MTLNGLYARKMRRRRRKNDDDDDEKKKEKRSVSEFNANSLSALPFCLAFRAEVGYS